MFQTNSTLRASAALGLAACILFASVGVEDAVLCIQEHGVRLEFSCNEGSCPSDAGDAGQPMAQVPKDACRHCVDIPLGEAMLLSTPSTPGTTRFQAKPYAHTAAACVPCNVAFSSKAPLPAPPPDAQRRTPVRECVVLLT